MVTRSHLAAVAAALLAVVVASGCGGSDSSYALLGALCAALGIGTLAGLYPAVRAARMAPTEALRTV